MRACVAMICLFLGSSFLQSAEAESTFSHFTLKNGLEVYLKALKMDEQSLSIELASKNGFATFMAPSPASYKISPDVAIASDSSSLFDGQDDAIDLYYDVDAFYSYWILETDAIHAKKAFEGLQRLLTSPMWNEKALQSSLLLSKQDIDRDELARRALWALNGLPEALINPYTEGKPQNPTLQDTAQAYRNLFLDPKRSVLVVSGNFEENTVKRTIIDAFGSIPAVENRPQFNEWKQGDFPKQPREALEGIIRKTDPVISLSFPLPYELTDDTFALTELLTQVLEESFKQDLSSSLPNVSSLDISLELPFYPELKAPWILVKLQSFAKTFQKDVTALSNAMKQLLSKGVDQESLRKAKEQIDISDSFWKNEPEYWLSFLGNQALMGFDPEKMLLKRKVLQNVELKDVNDLLKKFPPERFTIFISSGKED